MAMRHLTIAILAFGAFWPELLTAQATAPPQEVDAPLLPGVEVGATVSSERGVTFAISLNAGEAIEVSASQPDLDLRLRLSNPSGEPIGAGNLRRPQHGPERLHAVATASGAHRLSVEIAGGAPVDDIPITVIVDSIHEADARDRALNEAARAYEQADAEMAKGTGEAARAALSLFRKAVASWASAGASFEQATALNRIGLAELQLSNLRDALTAFEESGRIRRQIGDQYGVGVAIHNLAGTENRMANYEQAAALYEQAVQIRRAVNDRGGLGWSLIGVGVAQGRVREGWASAIRTYQEALEIFEEVRDERGIAEAFYYLGYAYKQMNEFDKATDYFDRALELRTKRNDIAGQASVLTQVAAIHLQLGDPQGALDIIDTSLTLRRRAGDRRGEAYTLQTAGVALTRLGDYSTALERLAEARQIFDAVGDRDGQTSALMHTATLHATAGKPALALDFAIRGRAVMEGRHNLAAAIFLSVVGDAQMGVGLHDEAAAAYESALVESRHLGETLPGARALAGLGRVARARGDLAASRRYLLDAIDSIESVRASVAQSELQSSFLAIAQSTYESAIETLIALDRRNPSAGYAAEALSVSERKRARAMLDMLAETRAELRAGVDRTLLEREDAIQRMLNERSAARATTVTNARDSAGAEDFDEEIATLVADLRSVRAEIRIRNPKYAALTRPALLDLAGIQRLLDPQTLLLEYSLGEHASYVWAITPTTMTLHQLPGRAVVENAVLRARDLIAQSAQRSVRGPLGQTLADLSTMVLGGVARELGRKRLVIVADGVLQFLPFGALPSPHRPSGGAGEDEPLVVTHEIVMLPSASIANVLRHAPSERPARKSVAVLADPVFQPDDPRATSDKDHSSPPSAQADSPERTRPSRDLARAAESVGVSRFERLLYSREEALAIAAKAGRSASLTALGFDATRELVLSPAMDGFRVMHFATHTVLDGRHPELSGIVLTLVDDRGQSVDGFLRLHDIFNMKLSADIVVLSACQTALGRDIRGEGLIGLTRGFMHAGASQVIASLWDVRDRSTAALMTELYAGLLQRGLPAPAALRAAQIAMWKHPRWRMPVHWAGFIVQGDWRAAP